MTTTESIFNPRRSGNINSSVQRLERISKNLLSLRTKLGSYTCEPKTLPLYEIKEQLKHQLDKTARANRELMISLKSKTAISDNSKVAANEQFEAFKRLEKKVLEYIRMAKLHC